MVENKCFCGKIHVRTGSRVLAAIFLVVTCVNLLNTLGFISGYPGSPISSLTIFICSWILVYGVFYERRYFILPILILQVFVISVILISFLLRIGLIMAYGEQLPEFADYLLINDLVSTISLDGNLVNILYLAIAFVITLFLNIYIFTIFFTYYSFLRDREKALLEEPRDSTEYCPLPQNPHALHQLNGIQMKRI